MATYTRPTVRRSYETIQADITEATAALAHNEGDRNAFWQAQAETCERLMNLWNEIVWQAVDDKKLPHWTRFAAMTTRDHFASLARDARRELATVGSA